MALAKKMQTINILLRSSTHSTDSIEYSLLVQNNQIQITPEYWSGSPYDETIGATRISNLRGYRVRIDLSYNASREYVTRIVSGGSYSASTYRSLFNEILFCYANGIMPIGSNVPFIALNVRILTDSGSTVIQNSSGDFYGFVPESMSYVQQYSNQIGRFIPAISLVSENLLTEIPSSLQGVL